MKFFFRLFTVLCLLSSVSARATELADLGSGLAYLRVHSLADSATAIRKAVPGAGALMLDLRYATANEESAGALHAALAGRPGTAPLFILVSPATPPAIVSAITQPAVSVFTLGIAGSRPAPKVVVQSDAGSDRRAYDALDTGTPLETLISGKIEKTRFDEATLVKEFKNGNPDAGPPPPPDPTAPKPEGAVEKPPALIDRVLQRAVHLQHALLALRR